eukprot:3449308-Rhodomonas_salina.2
MPVSKRCQCATYSRSEYVWNLKVESPTPSYWHCAVPLPTNPRPEAAPTRTSESRNLHASHRAECSNVSAAGQERFPP